LFLGLLFWLWFFFRLRSLFRFRSWLLLLGFRGTTTNRFPAFYCIEVR
jgi:hypothetical protein